MPLVYAVNVPWPMTAVLGGLSGPRAPSGIQQQQELKSEQQEETANAAKIAANKAAVAAVNKRFGELGDYNIWDETTVYFGNGKTEVDQQYFAKLQALAQKAHTVNGYMI